MKNPSSSAIRRCRLPVRRVRTPSTPTSVRPTVPVSLTPASSGTSCPPSRPIRRLKNGYTSAPVPGMPPGVSGPVLGEAEDAGALPERTRASRETAARSACRLIWRASTSVSPKSVLNVAVSLQARRDVVEDVEPGPPVHLIVADSARGAASSLRGTDAGPGRCLA